jgi:hypothetical protein
VAGTGSLGAAIGAVKGAAHGFVILPEAFAAASSVSGGFIIAAAGIADIFGLTVTGAMIGAGAGVAVGFVGAGGYLLGTAAYNTFTELYY